MSQIQIAGKELIKLEANGQKKNILILRNSGTTKLFDAHPLVEEFNNVHGTNCLVISHNTADVALNVGATWRSLVPMTPFAVDASIAYEKPGVRLGKEIVFSAGDGSRIVLPTTGDYKGEKNVALVALGLTSKDFQKDGDSMVLDISKDRLIPVPEFPGPDGLYMPHKETGVPHGDKVPQSPDARYLWRLNGSSYVGLLVRVVDDLGYGRQGVYAYFGPSGAFGVALEVPEGDTEKIQALLASNVQSGKPAEKETIIKVPGISADELKAAYNRAVSAVGRMPGIIDAQIVAPIREFLDAVGKAL
jgi:hypothetical protein